MKRKCQSTKKTNFGGACSAGQPLCSPRGGNKKKKRKVRTRHSAEDSFHRSSFHAKTYHYPSTCLVRAVDHGKHLPYGTYVKLTVQMSKEWQNYTLAKKSSAANPGITLGGSSFVINANPTDSISRVPLKMHSVHKGRLKF